MTRRRASRCNKQKDSKQEVIEEEESEQGTLSIRLVSWKQVSRRCEQEKDEQMNKQKDSKQEIMVENNRRTDRKPLA